MNKLYCISRRELGWASITATSAPLILYQTSRQFRGNCRLLLFRKHWNSCLDILMCTNKWYAFRLQLRWKKWKEKKQQITKVMSIASFKQNNLPVIKMISHNHPLERFHYQLAVKNFFWCVNTLGDSQNRIRRYQTDLDMLCFIV